MELKTEAEGGGFICELVRGLGAEASPHFGQNLYFEHKYKIFRPPVSFSFEKSVFLGEILIGLLLFFLTVLGRKIE